MVENSTYRWEIPDGRCFSIFLHIENNNYCDLVDWPLAGYWRVLCGFLPRTNATRGMLVGTSNDRFILMLACG